MRWLEDLTPRQRLIVGGLAVGVVVVVGVMTWMVWRSTQMLTPLSLLPTPTPGPTATPQDTPTPGPTPTPFFDTVAAGTLAREVAEARGVLPRWETPLTLIDTYDLSVILYRRYQTQLPFPLSDRTTFETLGLWSSRRILEPDPVAQAEQAAALYFPEEGQLYLRKDWEEVATLRALVAYGYARALADQYGDLARLQTAATSLDHRLTLEALAAGDALLALSLHAGVAPDSPEAQALMDTVIATTLPVWRNGFPLLDDLTALPLALGRDFAAAIYEEGGLAAMDEAVRRPPRTTEQLHHPKDYRDRVAFTVFEPLDIDLGAGWEPALTETIGESLMSVTFAEWNADVFTATIEGWDGDLLQIWNGPDDRQVILWQTAWDSTQDATTVATALRDTLPAQVRGTIQSTTLPSGLPWGQWWESAQDAAYARRYIEEVWLVWGTDITAVETIAAALETIP